MAEAAKRCRDAVRKGHCLEGFGMFRLPADAYVRRQVSNLSNLSPPASCLIRLLRPGPQQRNNNTTQTSEHRDFDLLRASWSSAASHLWRGRAKSFRIRSCPPRTYANPPSSIADSANCCMYDVVSKVVSPPRRERCPPTLPGAATIDL